MTRRDLGLILLVVGILCAIVFALLNLSGVPNKQLVNLVTYVGIIAVVAGLVIFVATSSKG